MENRARFVLKKVNKILRPPMVITMVLIGLIIEFLLEIPFIIAMGIGKLFNPK